MVTTTPKLGLPRPEGHDNVTRENHVALIDAIDENAASQSEMDTVRDIAEQAQQTADDAATAAANAQSDIDEYKNEISSLGLGIDVDPRLSSDLNIEIQTGWVRFESGETANAPGEQIASFPHSGVVRVDRRNNNRLVQTAYGVAGATSVRIAVRALGSAGWGDWVEILHTGNATPEVIGAETPSGAQAKVDAHASRTDNPHNVTKAQVGLGNVQNYGIATKAQAEAGTANNVYMTPLRVQEKIANGISSNGTIQTTSGSYTARIRVTNNRAVIERIGPNFTGGIRIALTKVIEMGSNDTNPNGVYSAPPGSLCFSTPSSGNAGLFYKRSGTGNTGWVPVVDL